MQTKQFNSLEECIKEIKRLRIQVDALIQIANDHRVSAECTLALRELQMAKSWLGKLLGDVSKTPSPYVIVNKPELIPATQEVAELAPYKFDSTLDMCNSQRNIIEDTIQNTYNLFWDLQNSIGEHNYNLETQYSDGNGGMLKENFEKFNKKKINLNRDYESLITQYLHQARFWYGFELANIKKQYESNN